MSKGTDFDKNLKWLKQNVNNPKFAGKKIALLKGNVVFCDSDGTKFNDFLTKESTPEMMVVQL